MAHKRSPGVPCPQCYTRNVAKGKTTCLSCVPPMPRPAAIAKRLGMRRAPVTPPPKSNSGIRMISVCARCAHGTYSPVILKSKEILCESCYHFVGKCISCRTELSSMPTSLVYAMCNACAAKRCNVCQDQIVSKGQKRCDACNKQIDIDQHYLGEGIIGIRLYYWDPYLKHLTGGYRGTWYSPRQKAKCVPEQAHPFGLSRHNEPPPAPRGVECPHPLPHRCGINAYRPDSLTHPTADFVRSVFGRSNGVNILAICQLWGKIIEHEDGVRAEQCDMLALMPIDNANDRLLKTWAKNNKPWSGLQVLPGFDFYAAKNKHVLENPSGFKMTSPMYGTSIRRSLDYYSIMDYGRDHPEAFIEHVQNATMAFATPLREISEKEAK